MPAIEIQELTVRHGDLVAVDDVSLTAEAGATVALLGPNGAGKTTLIETLEGYRRPDAGSARVLGLDPFAQHDQLVDRIGVMLQNGGIQTGIRPVEALELYAALADDPLDPDDLLDRVGLGARARTAWRNLSGGEQRRLSLALALVEPTRRRVPRRTDRRGRRGRAQADPRDHRRAALVRSRVCW